MTSLLLCHLIHFLEIQEMFKNVEIQLEPEVVFLDPFEVLLLDGRLSEVVLLGFDVGDLDQVLNALRLQQRGVLLFLELGDPVDEESGQKFPGESSFPLSLGHAANVFGLKVLGPEVEF